MFAGDMAEARTRFAEAGLRNLAEGRDLAALMCEMSVCQAMTYAGDAAEARQRLVGLRQRARASRNPSALAWALYVTGEATAEVDVPSALHAYRAAAEEALKVDNRLFLGLARSSAVALASRRGSPLEVLAEFERVMAEWDELGNVAAQWWMLLQIALLLGGAVLTESTFEWKGLGFQLVHYLQARDFVAVQGMVVLLAVIVTLTNFVVDVIAALIDPRVRY